MKCMKKETIFWILLIIFSVGFASWLMFHTFSYDIIDPSMRIAAKAWSDFGAHIPLIRSFSLGNNWPPEYPLFPGEPIRYHFLFYFLVGMLEKAGLRIDWALNIPSIIGFTGLMIGIAILAQKLFNDKRITVLSVLFFLFNGSLSWIRFFIAHPPSIHSLQDIVTNTTFPSFAPWGDGDISAFWNLNIYTNQRHLGFAFALVCVFIIILLHIENKKMREQMWYLIPLISISAIFPYFHQPMLLILALCMLCYFLLFPKLRGILLLTGIFSFICVVPQILSFPTQSKQLIHWYPGYLIHDSLTISHFFLYWFQNIGLHLLLIPIGWILASKKAKKIFIPYFLLFVLANTVQFSSEIVGNHKFLNFFLIIGHIYSAYSIIMIMNMINRKHHLIIRCITRSIAITIICILILSGFIDGAAVANDEKISLTDISGDTVTHWIYLNTPPTSIFLTQDYFMQPPSVAGRPIFLGWPYFPWSLGYDTQKRGNSIKQIFQSTSKQDACLLLISNNISYIFYNTNSAVSPNTQQVSPLYVYNFTPLYTNADGFIILDIANNCQ